MIWEQIWAMIKMILRSLAIAFLVFNAAILFFCWLSIKGG